MNYWNEVNREIVDGFDIVFSIATEETDPCDLFDSAECDIQQLYDDINSGRCLWFTARVQAFRVGVELAVDYLGGCMYKSTEEFMADAYYTDMIDNVIRDASEKITLLTKP